MPTLAEIKVAETQKIPFLNDSPIFLEKHALSNKKLVPYLLVFQENCEDSSLPYGIWKCNI